MNEVYEFLKSCGTFYLATTEGDQPRVRPFGAVAVFEDKLYIQTGKVKKVADQMKANPKIEISGMAGGKWIRLTAKAVLDERIEAQQHMLDENPGLKRMNVRRGRRQHGGLLPEGCHRQHQLLHRTGADLQLLIRTAKRREKLLSKQPDA